MPTPRCDHRLDTLARHIVRETFPGQPDRAHEDVGEYAADMYAYAVEHARTIRSGAPNVYAVIDPVYACGCRGRG